VVGSAVALEHLFSQFVRHEITRSLEVVTNRVVDEVADAARVDAGEPLDLLAEVASLPPLPEDGSPVRIESPVTPFAQQVNLLNEVRPILFQFR
jgi:hypothetical protein